MPDPSDTPPSSAWWSTRGVGAVSLTCLALGALTLLGAVVQMQFGVLGHREWPLPPASKIKMEDHAYKAKLPAWGTGKLAERRVVLLRDGQPVGMRVPHARTVLERGGGAFKIQRDYLYFSLPANEDPRPHLGQLAVSLPRPVKADIWAAGAALFLLGALGTAWNPAAKARLQRATDALEAMPNGMLITGVAAIALAVTLSRLPEALAYSDGSFSVKGVPYSDAAGWDELAINLAEGRGFTGGFAAQRPLFPAMIGLVYVVTGPSLFAAKLLNAFWLALAATAVAAIGIAGGSRLVGLAGALGVLTSGDNTLFSKLLLTEISGLAFGTTAVLALAVAVARPSWWRISLAALLLAGANLANGFALFALLGYGAVALAAWWLKQGPRKALVQSVVLAGLVAFAWMPWLLRQKLVHGIWNLSTSSAVLMFAVASPEHGKFSVEAGGAWQAAGVPDEHGARYRFYMEKYAEIVKEHPAAYARAFLDHMEEFAGYWQFEGPEHFGVPLLGLLCAAVWLRRRRRWWSALVAGSMVIGVCLLLHGETSELLWPLATALVLLTCPPRQRAVWGLVAVTALFVTLLGGMIGGNLARRMWTACAWTMPLLIVMGGMGAMQWLAALLERTVIGTRKPSGSEDTAAASPSLPAWVTTGLGLVMLTHAALGSAVTTGLWLMKCGKPEAVLRASTADRAHALALAAAHAPFLQGITNDDARLWTVPCTFGDYTVELDAHEDVQHWGRSFAVRPYARTVATAHMLDTQGDVACQMRLKPDALPRHTPLLVIGIVNRDPKAHLGHDTMMVEVLGLVPVKDGAAAWDRAVWLPTTPEASAIMKDGP